MGCFGVSLQGAEKRLAAMPSQLTFGDLREQGLPFYGAGINYPVYVPEVSQGQRVVLHLDGFDAACVKVGEQVIGFAPYQLDVTKFAGREVCLEYMLTRRNTFGPLHECPAVVGGYGPGNFVTEGAQFCGDQYALLPQGMTKRVWFTVEEKGE